MPETAVDELLALTLNCVFVRRPWVAVHSYWRLGEGEVLEITATPPVCDMWNFQLNNHWMESLDFRYFPIHVNSHSARYEDDGSVRILVAHKDPNVREWRGNWIDTAGHSCGTMCFRWIHPRCREEDLPKPRARVVAFADICDS